MKLKIEINCGNAAFGETNGERWEELEQILKQVAEDQYGLMSGDKYPLFDSNGNKVGYIKLTR